MWETPAQRRWRKYKNQKTQWWYRSGWQKELGTGYWRFAWESLVIFVVGGLGVGVWRAALYSYVAKYIAKNIDGEHVGADLYGHDAIDSAIRIRAWASIWDIRQFLFIGSPSITVWREARRFASSEAAQETLERIGSDQLTAIVDACDKGDFKAFVELSGGATVPLKDQPLRALHVAKETPNKYGEAIKKLIGLCFKGVETIKTHVREWIVRPVDLSIKKNDFGIGFALGGANAPPLEFCQ